MGQLTVEQRYIIQTLREEGFSQTEIAKRIERDKSVVCRELQRNSDKRNGKYKAVLAERKCSNRHKIKPKKVWFTLEIEQHVEELLKQDYSPEQIVGYSKINQRPCVSSERIYQYIWENKKQGGILYQHLRTKGKRYRKRGAKKDKRGQIPNKVCIDKRPKEVEQKQRVGDLEVDLVIGKNHRKAIVTANDRATGKTKIGLVNSKSAEEVKEKIIAILSEWKPLLKTITSDNGKEFAKHEAIANSLGIDYYFAKPYHSWERGANENYNGLLRQYFPKECNFDLITEERLLQVEEKLNARPRKRFGFLSPNQVFLQAINNDGIVAFIT